MFPCTGCGLCCQNIVDIEELKAFDLGNGTCRYLNRQDNSCSVYDTRPDICKIETMFAIKYHQFFTKSDFYIENAKVCNELQNKYNLDENFRVNIGVQKCK